MLKTHLFFLLFALPLPVLHAQVYRVDVSRSSIKFTVVHMSFLEVDGEFHSFDGSTKRKNSNTLKDVVFKIEVKSIDTGDKMRDRSLMDEDIFDAKAYPLINFEGKVIDRQQLIGFLTIKDVQQSISISSLQITQLEQVIHVTFEYVLLRSDFNLHFDLMDDLVGDKIKIMADLYLVKN